MTTAQTRAYLALSAALAPAWRATLRRRARRGKEDPARLGEKFGQASAPRPDGPVLWAHALSVGESLTLLPLLAHAVGARPALSVVLTTTTASSAEALARVGLPSRVVHQFAPIDTPGPVAAFLDHWRPDAALVTELDLWPRSLAATGRRGIPRALVNTQLTPRMARRRARTAGLMRDMLGGFARICAQDEASAGRLADLGAREDALRVLGSLKGGAEPLPVDAGELKALIAATRGRPVWLAAATHGAETPAVAAAHRDILARRPEALLLLAPRHPAEADADAAALGDLTTARRSRSEPITPETQVYLADTFGEMGLWYRLAPVSLVAHSLLEGVEGVRGKTPYEAMALGSAVIFGPATEDFAATFAEIERLGAGRRIAGPDDLAAAVLAMWAERERPLAAADALMARRAAVIPDTWAEIADLLPD